MVTREQIESGYAAPVTTDLKWEVHILQALREIACQLADMNQQMASESDPESDAVTPIKKKK